jgi:magnesium transporter
MHITYFQERAHRELAPADLAAQLASGEGTLWVDVTGPSPEDLELLRRVFDFHPLALEDTYNQKQRPKAEEFEDHLFIILNPLRHIPAEDELFRELDVFVGKNYLVSVHAEEEPLLELVRARLEPGRTSFAISATYLLYVLLDTVVDDYAPMLEHIEDELDELGNVVFAKPARRVLSRLFELQQMLIHTARILEPQRDVLNVLVNHQLVFIDQDSRYYLRDVADHLLRATDRVRAMRDTVNSLLNLYISAVSYRLNRDVNRLTLLAVIVGSLTVISGFYGMNFTATWPPFSAWWGVPAVLLMMLGAVLSLIYSIGRQR